MSGASSLRNAVKRVTHKERAQPSDRKRFGLLEKHKDYIIRANDFKKKKKALGTLKRKAENRNPDEFYFRMNKSKVKDGIHQNERLNQLDNSTISLLKSQDMGYISLRKAMDDSKIQQLRSSLHSIGEKPVKSHKIFVPTEADVERFDLSDHFDTSPELVHNAFNRKRRTPVVSKDQSSIGAALSSSVGLTARAVNDKPSISRNNCNSGTSSKFSTSSAAYKELKARKKRSEKLKRAMNELALQRQLSNSKGSRKKVVVAGNSGSSSSAQPVVVYKWKRQRSR